METSGTESIGTSLPFDTLSMSKHLRRHGYSKEQAEGQVELLKHVVESNLATKTDLARVEAVLKTDIANVEATLKRDIEGIRTELKRDIEELRKELKTDIARVEATLRTDIANVKVDIANVKADLIKTIIGWIIGAVIVQSGLIAALKILG